MRGIQATALPIKILETIMRKNPPNPSDVARGGLSRGWKNNSAMSQNRHHWGQTGRWALNEAQTGKRRDRRDNMTDQAGSRFTRRGILGAFAATAITAAPTFANAAGFLRGAGDIRRIRMSSPRTGETMDTIYWIEGDYIKDALKEIEYFMRDWRSDEVHNIDTRTIDILTAAHNLLEVNEPYMLLSGYRSPATNAMLRRRSSGVAKNSRHMQGQAADVRLATRSVNQMYRAALACNGGGVGRYSRSDFVHMDCGPVRSWGR